MSHSKGFQQYIKAPGFAILPAESYTMSYKRTFEEMLEFQSNLQQQEIDKGTLIDFGLFAVIHRACEQEKVTVLPNCSCMAFPVDDGRGREQDPILSTEYKSIGISIHGPGGLKEYTKSTLKGCCELIFRSTEDLFICMDIMLHDIEDSMDYELRISSVHGDFPFEGTRGRSFLEGNPMLGSFCDFEVKQPENLLVCRRLILDDVSFPISEKFKRRLDSFRGSLALPWLHSTPHECALVDALANSNVHLDTFYISPCFDDDDDQELARSMFLQLASISCNLLIWNANQKWALSFAHELVEQSASRLSLRLNYMPDEFDTFEDFDRESARALELSCNNRVQELDWTVERYSTYRYLPPSYEAGLRNLGQLSFFRLSMFERARERLLDEVLDALSPPTASSLQLQFLDTDSIEIIRIRLCSYVRKHPTLEKFEFRLLEKDTDDLNVELDLLVGDNKRFRHIRDSPSTALAYLLQGRAIQRPPVLFFALRQKISELVDNL